MTDANEKMIYKLMKNQTNSTHIQLLRYIFVGGAAFLIDFTFLYVFTDILSIYYLFSAAAAFTLGLVANYAMSINWVFNKRIMGNVWSEFMIFSFIGVIGLGLNEIFIWFFTEYASFYYLTSKMIAAALILFWNFSVRKLALFR